MTKDSKETKDSETLKRAERRIHNMGLPLPEKPKEDKENLVEWPGNVGDLEFDELSHQMTWWSGWAAYTAHQLARAKTNLQAFKEDHERKRSEYIYKSSNDYDTVTEMKSAVDQRSDMQARKARILEAEAMVTMLKAILQGYEQKYATVSREIAIRGKGFSPDQLDSFRNG